MNEKTYIKWSIIASVLGVIALTFILIREFVIKGLGSDLEIIGLIVFPFLLLNPIINLWKSKKTILQSKLYYLLEIIYFISIIIIYIRPLITYAQGNYNLAETMFGVFPVVMLVANFIFLISTIFIKKIYMIEENYRARIPLIFLVITILIQFKLEGSIFNLMDMNYIKKLACNLLSLFLIVKLFFSTLTYSFNIKIMSGIIILLSLLNLNFLAVFGAIFIFFDADKIGVKDL